MEKIPQYCALILCAVLSTQAGAQTTPAKPPEKPKDFVSWMRSEINKALAAETAIAEISVVRITVRDDLIHHAK